MDKSIQKYLSKQYLAHFIPQYNNHKAFVIIPVYQDFMIFNTLKSINETITPSKINPAIIIVVNHPENSPDKVVKKNKIIFDKLNTLTLNYPLYVLTAYDIRKKEAGVGFARKVGMDTASYYFFQNNISDGLLISLDADTLVAQNYFVTIEKHFFTYQECRGISLYYEHLFLNNDLINKAISQYELYLRYYVTMLRHIDFPFAFHTIGSAFVVRYQDYILQGGMPKKQGGEDFYFLNKIMLGGNYCDLTSTTVYPSARPTQKTPFGTGKTIYTLTKSPDSHLKTYNTEAFYLLKSVFENHIKLFETKDCENYINNNIENKKVNEFLSGIEFCKHINLILQNTKNKKTFRKAFFTWFNGFKAVKLLNFLHTDNYLHKMDIEKAAFYITHFSGVSQQLDIMRGKDKTKSLYLTDNLNLETIQK